MLSVLIVVCVYICRPIPYQRIFKPGNVMLWISIKKLVYDIEVDDIALEFQLRVSLHDLNHMIDNGLIGAAVIGNEVPTGRNGMDQMGIDAMIGNLIQHGTE
jgi:hypothetical protein